MLVLTRRTGENIRIGENIVITVLKIGPGQVKIGVDAPQSVVVHREEIFERIQEANRRAAGLTRDALSDAARALRGDTAAEETAPPALPGGSEPKSEGEKP